MSQLPRLSRRFLRPPPPPRVVLIALALGCGTLLLCVGRTRLFAEAEEQQPAPTALQQRLKDVAQKISVYLANGEVSSRAYQINAPALLLKLEKARLLAARGPNHYLGGPTAEGQLDLAEKILDLCKRKKPIYEGLTGLQERAYLSAADHSAQPYWVNVPKNYTPDKKWPLVAFLHGYDPSIDKVNAWLPPAAVLELFADRGYILVIPYGRRNTDFVTIGEVDTLTCLDQCRKLFNVDDNRVYLGGVSMGGYGVYAITSHYPDIFAAAAAACGRTDHYLWRRLDRRDVVPFKRLMIDTDNPWDLLGNFRNLPFHLQQGQFDTLVDPLHSRRTIKEFEKRGFIAKYEEIPGEDHWIYFGNECYERMLNWFDQYTRDPAPRKVSYRTFSPKYHRAYWVSIEEFQRFGQLAEVTAETTETNRFDLTTTNVARLTLELRKELVDPAKPVVVQVNGKPAFTGQVEVGNRLSIRVGEPSAESPPEGLQPKGPQLCGPVREAYNTSFLVVYGTLGDDEADAASKALARRAVVEWYQFADGVAPMKADTEVNQADMDGSNLILYGDERTNALVARMRDKLPFRLEGGTVSIQEHTYDYAAGDLGVLLTYPNPLAPQRLVVISAGRFWGESLPLNHKFDLLPDYIVFNGDAMYDKTNQYLCAGFFDRNWRFDPSLVWYGPSDEVG